jgi:hypothetical protein
MRATSRAICLALSILLAASPRAWSQVAIPPMLGLWQGDAEIVVTWTRQRTLPVRIEIHPDDRVTGTIGEATLVGAKLIRVDDERERTARWKTDYVISSNLTGPLIRKETIWRTSVELWLDWRDQRFQGGLTTSGWKVAGSERRVLDAVLVLRRAPIKVVCETSPSLFEP